MEEKEWGVRGLISGDFNARTKGDRYWDGRRRSEGGEQEFER